MNAELYRRVCTRWGNTCQGCFKKEEESSGITVRPIDMRRDVQNLNQFTEEELTLYCNDCAFRFLNYLSVNKAQGVKKIGRKNRLSLEERRARTLKNLEELQRSTLVKTSDKMKGNSKVREPTKPRSKK